MDLENLDPALRATLLAIYEDMMYLAARPNVTAGLARAWYTHLMSRIVQKQIRRFTGRVSKAAIDSEPKASLVLEHPGRIQTTLTKMVERHRETPNADEFLALLAEHEIVNIVTFAENYAARKAGGDYEKAGIVLVDWGSVEIGRREQLWIQMVRGKVANAAAFRPVRSGAE